jgi:hypothetical protein
MRSVRTAAHIWTMGSSVIAGKKILRRMPFIRQRIYIRKKQALVAVEAFGYEERTYSERCVR